MSGLERHVRLIWNRKASAKITGKSIAEAEEYFTDKGYEFRFYEPKSLEATRDITLKIAEEAADSDYSITLVPIGGDGTINLVVNAIFSNYKTCPLTLGIIPGGTGNLLAQKLGILTAADKLAAATGWYDMQKYLRIIADGRIKDIDIIELSFEDRKEYAVSWTGFGFTPNIISKVKEEQKKNIKEWAYIPPALALLGNYVPQKIKIFREDDEFEGCCVDIGNNELLGLPRFRYFKGAKLDDGYLQTMIVEHHGKNTQTAIFDIIMRVFAGTHLSHPRMKHFSSGALAVKPMENMLYHIDGEVYQAKKDEKITIRARPKALPVIY